MIANHDQRALLEFRVDAARGVGEIAELYSHAAEDAHGKNNFLRGITFVEMHAALHGGDGNFAHFPNYQAAGVADSRRTRKAGNFFIGNACCFRQFVGERAEPRAEHHRDLRDEAWFSTRMNFAA